MALPGISNYSILPISKSINNSLESKSGKLSAIAFSMRLIRSDRREAFGWLVFP